MDSSHSHHAAANAVLNNNELLCEIIAHLPLEDIVVATGVCQAWRKALKANVAIQKALFLAPAEIQTLRTIYMDCLDMNCKDIPRGCYTIVGEPHPLVAKICCQTISLSNFEDNDRRDVGIEEKTSFRHSDGGWRDMFITQPPCKVIVVAT